MPTDHRSIASQKLAILPMWVIDRIKEEMRLGPAAWQAITDAVAQAEVPQALPCEVKLPPGTVVGQGSPLSTLLMAIALRASQPAHAQVFCSEPPAPQPHPEPIAWMVGTAFWWTKEEAERDAAETGLPIVGLGPMTGDVEAARLTKVTAFVQRLVDCAGTQPSVATGYLRDILDELKGNTTPTAPVAHNENAAFESWARSRLTPLNLRLDEIGLYHDLVAGTAHDAWQARAALEIKAS